MNNYIIPEGMKFLKESCFLNWFKLLEVKLPSYDCTPHFVSIEWEPTVRVPIELVLNYDGIISGIIMILAMGLLGGIIIELLYNKLDWYLDPLCKYVNRRYRIVIERGRLHTMNGHP